MNPSVVATAIAAVWQVHVEHGVGHGGYDCNAGASNWIQGALAFQMLCALGGPKTTLSMLVGR